MNTTAEQEILQFATDNWGEKDIPAALLKLSEEMGEVAGACVKISENRSTWDEFDDEVGDVLIVLSQVAALRGHTLGELREARFEKIKARAARKPACAACDRGDYTLGHSDECQKAAKAYVCDCGDRSLGLRGRCVKTEQPTVEKRLFVVGGGVLSNPGRIRPHYLEFHVVASAEEAVQGAVDFVKKERPFLSSDSGTFTAVEVTNDLIDFVNQLNGHQP